MSCTEDDRKETCSTGSYGYSIWVRVRAGTQQTTGTVKRATQVDAWPNTTQVQCIPDETLRDRILALPRRAGHANSDRPWYACFTLTQTDPGMPVFVSKPNANADAHPGPNPDPFLYLQPLSCLSHLAMPRDSQSGHRRWGTCRASCGSWRMGLSVAHPNRTPCCSQGPGSGFGFRFGLGWSSTRIEHHAQLRTRSGQGQG